jgi:hypothetical protein
MKFLRGLTVLGLLALASMQVNAHHAWAAIFDADGDIEIEGVVTEVLWRNPHVQMLITTDPGTPEEVVWTIESNAVSRLTPMGVTADVLPIGAPVKIAGLPSLQGKNEIFLNNILLPDQTEVLMSRTVGRRWTDEAGAVIGDVTVLHGSVIEEDYSKRPATVFGVWNTIYDAEGSHRSVVRASDDWTDHALAFQEQQRAAGLGGRPDRHDCSPRTSTGALFQPYPKELVDLGDTIEIRAEFLDTYRTVYMDPTKAIPAEIPKDHLGYSRGHWLGDTLAVETIIYREGGIDGDDYMQVHETFSLSADHNRLSYTHLTIDPLMRKTPRMDQRWWQHTPGAVLQRYDCAGAITLGE